MAQEAQFKELLSKVGGEYDRLRKENRLLLAEVRHLRLLSNVEETKIRELPTKAEAQAESDPNGSLGHSEDTMQKEESLRSEPESLNESPHMPISVRYSARIEAASFSWNAGARSRGPAESDADSGPRTVRIVSPRPAEEVAEQREHLREATGVSSQSCGTPSRFDSNPSIFSAVSAKSNAGGVTAFSWRPKRKSSITFDRKLTVELAAATAHMSTASKGSIVINPTTSNFLAIWDIIILVALSFVVVVSPVHVAMFQTSLDPMFIVNCIVDLVFLVDLLLQFFIMFPKDIRYGHVLEFRHSKIIVNYLKTWFVVDFLSVVPFEAFSLVTSWNPAGSVPGGLKVMKIVRIMRLVKLTRVMRAPRLVSRIQLRMSLTYKTLSLLQFVTILATITHWLTSLWAFTLVLVDEDEGVPRWIDDFEALEVNVRTKTVDTWWKLYITCFYFTTYTLTSVGYGDIGPKNIVERVICTVIIIISGTSWAVVLGQVGGIIADMNPSEHEYRSEMDDLHGMLADQMVPLGMRQRIIGFFKANKVAQRRTRHNYLMQTMSPGLRGEVMTQLYSEWMTKVSFLKRILEDAESKNSLLLRNFVYSLSSSMTIEAHAQAELFGAPRVLYILNRGLVGRRIRVYPRGSVWGHDFVLANASLLEPVESLAMTYVEVTTVTSEVFFGLVEKHGVGCPELKRHVRVFIRWLSFQRAIKYIVKKEKKRLAALPSDEDRRLTRMPTRDLHGASLAPSENATPMTDDVAQYTLELRDESDQDEACSVAVRPTPVMHRG